MINYHCLICGEATKRPIEAIWWHLRPIENPREWWGFLSGTYRTFGLRAVVTLVSPLLNTLIHWKYRYHRLEFSGQNLTMEVRRGTNDD